MTAPTPSVFAEQLAQARDSLEKLRMAGRTSAILKVWCDDGIAALDLIEQRAAEMERLLVDLGEFVSAETSGFGEGGPLLDRIEQMLGPLSAREEARIDEGSPHAEPYDVPADPEPEVREEAQ